MEYKLSGVLPVPKNRLQSISWEFVENNLGTPLPDDYKWFAENYGAGKIGSFIKIWVPDTNVTYLNLVKQSRKLLMGLISSRKQLAEDKIDTQFIFNLYPDRGGLLPVGRSIDGDLIFWKTLGEPNDWTVVIQEVRSENYEHYPMNITDFLYNLIEKNIETFFDETDFDVDSGFVKLDS